MINVPPTPSTNTSPAHPLLLPPYRPSTSHSLLRNLQLLLLLLAMANDQSRCRNRLRKWARERDRDKEGRREREGALKSCQAGPKTSTPSPKNRERIDRNYAIKIKQCGVIFMVRFSMRTDTHTQRRALAKVRVSLRLSERDGTKVIIYNCPCCSNCSFNSAAADKIVSYCRRCGAGRTRLSQGQGQE